MEDFLDRADRGEKTHPDCEPHRAVGLGSRLNTEEKTACLCLLTGCDVPCCLVLLPPRLPHRD